MAIYHLSVSNVSRGAGSSSVASLSYITAEPQRDEYWHQTYNGFGRRERVIETSTLLPAGAPAEWCNAGKLFNSIEMAEKSADARTAKKIVVALPRELTAAQRREAVETYIHSEITARGYAAVYAIHEDSNGMNPHAHILVPNRQIDPKTGGWAKHKQRSEYVRDANGERVPLIDPKTGKQKLDGRNRKQWKRRSIRLNPLDSKETLESLRSGWAKTCNELLPEGVSIDHRSNEARGIDLEPTVHEGYAAREIEKRGGVSDRCEMNREIRQRNGLLEAMRRRMAALGEQIHAITGQIARILEALRQRRQQPTADPRDWVPAARRQLEAERDRRVAGLRADLTDARQSLDSRRSWLTYNTGEEWRQHVLPSLKRVRAAMETTETAGLLKRGKARRELETVAAAETATIRKQAPWLTIGPIPTSRAELDIWDADSREQGKAHELTPLKERVTQLTEQIDREQSRPITSDQIGRLARQMAENSPQTREQPRHGPEPQDDPFGTYSPAQEARKASEEQPKRRMTVSDLRAKLKADAARRMEDQAEREAEQQLDPFAWMPDDPGRTHGLSR